METTWEKRSTGKALSGSRPWTSVEGWLEWGSPVDECEREGIVCNDVGELEGELV